MVAESDSCIRFFPPFSYPFSHLKRRTIRSRTGSRESVSTPFNSTKKVHAHFPDKLLLRSIYGEPSDLNFETEPGISFVLEKYVAHHNTRLGRDGSVVVVVVVFGSAVISAAAHRQLHSGISLSYRADFGAAADRMACCLFERSSRST